MSKVKYYYDADTLSYRKIERKKGAAIKYVALFLTASILFAFLLVFVAGQFIESPKEKVLARELENMEFQYQLLNDRLDEAGYGLGIGGQGLEQPGHYEWGSRASQADRRPS